MNDRNNFNYGQEDSTGVRNDAHARPGFAGPFRFSEEEMRVFAECETESFYKRSLPIGSVLVFGTIAAIRKGYLRPNPRFGAIPKATLAAAVGYFIGKLSYQDVCAEKLMALPGSYIGQVLRERRDGKVGSTLTNTSPSMFGATNEDIYSDAGPGSSLDLDTDRPLFSDDSYQPSSGGILPTNPPPPRASIAYDDLRERNRREYAEKRQNPYRADPVEPTSQAQPSLPVSDHDSEPSPRVPKRANKYGDIVE